MIFEFSWSWYEDYSPHLFESNDKTKAEFEADCKKAMVECFDDYMSDDNKGWAAVPDWIDRACDKLEEFGYDRIKPTHFGLFGGYIVDENDITDDEFKDFPEQMKKMSDYNTAFRKEMDKDMGIT